MEHNSAGQFKFDEFLKKIVPTAIKVITNPVDFFKEMEKRGGLLEPLMFVVVMGIVTGIINVLLSIVGLSYMGGLGMALFSVIVTPIYGGIFSFIGGGVLYLIWKMMGSQESYETSYRCGAYIAVVGPVSAVLNIIPYAGTAVAFIWTTYLLVIASSEVHKLKRETAWIVFGIIFLILLLMNISSQYAGRRMARQMVEFQQEMGNGLGRFSPAEQRKMADDFIKRMQEQGGMKNR